MTIIATAKTYTPTPAVLLKRGENGRFEVKRIVNDIKTIVPQGIGIVKVKRVIYDEEVTITIPKGYYALTAEELVEKDDQFINICEWEKGCTVFSPCDNEDIGIKVGEFGLVIRKWKPVPGHFLRGLMTVSQIAKAHGLSKNKAARLRETCPLACLYDFPGQQPLANDLASVHSFMVEKLVA